ncbi:MAG: hypothetical protein ABL973_16355 [Micropepsaceae bacterium]
MRSARFTDTIEPGWESARRLRAGVGQACDAAPDVHVLVEGADVRLVIDVFGPSLQSFTFSAVELWHDLVVIGYGSALYVVRPSNGWSLYVAIPGYFGSLYMGDAGTDYCLVATDSEILRVSPEGQIMWRQGDLAADGVIISDVADGVIKASGQWDPPDAAWTEFRLNLATGERLG